MPPNSSPAPALVSLDDIRAAAGRIRGVAVRTPVLEIDTSRGLQRADLKVGLYKSGQTASDRSRTATLALKCEKL